MENQRIDRLKPILLLLAAYGLAWIDLFLPQPQIALFSSSWYVFSAAKSVLRFIFIAILTKAWFGSGASGLSFPCLFPQAKDAANGILIAAAAIAVALLFAFLSLFSGARNPLLYPFGGSSRQPLSIFLMMLSSLGIGYSEELFFRFFAVKAFEKSGFSSSGAVLASALLFGASHGSQGVFGMISAAILALLFSFFMMRGKSLHALALGHALYDFAILLAVS